MDNHGRVSRYSNLVKLQAPTGTPRQPKRLEKPPYGLEDWTRSKRRASDHEPLTPYEKLKVLVFSVVVLSIAGLFGMAAWVAYA